MFAMVQLAMRSGLSRDHTKCVGAKKAAMATKDLIQLEHQGAACKAFLMSTSIVKNGMVSSEDKRADDGGAKSRGNKKDKQDVTNFMEDCAKCQKVMTEKRKQGVACGWCQAAADRTQKGGV